MTDLAPLFRLHLTTPRLELRLGTPAEIDELGRLARRGIHRPEEMPFGVAWTDRADKPTFAEEFRAYHERRLAAWSPESWGAGLLVWEDGVLVGEQSLAAKRFATERTVGTGSWLGAKHQGRGIGTEMRSAVLELAFAGLGAVAATSGWLAGNRSSARVSEKLGYRETGISEMSPRGVPVPHHDVRLKRVDWISPVPVEITGLEDARPLFGA
jgi:RimJ/RimL family protein N-acetyltransferase